MKNVVGENVFIEKTTSKLGMNIQETGIYTKHEGALQTHLLYKTISDMALDIGVKIYGGCTVSTFEQQNKKWFIYLEEGYTLECHNLIVCTNGFAKELIPELDVEPARGQILVTSAIPSLPWHGLMHADKGYIYLRSLGTRILIGGARNTDFNAENTNSMEITTQIQSKLIAFLKQVVIPNQEFEITDSWAGIMGMNANRTPIVKQVQTGMYACVRMGGMGVALSSLVSRQLAELVE